MDLIRKRWLKQLKEIYESYYWLVTHIDPFRIGLNTAFFHYIKTSPPGVKVIHTIYPYPPDCLYTAIGEMRMKASNVFEKLSLEIPTADLKTKEGRIGMVTVLKTKYDINQYEDEAYNYGCSKRPLEPIDILDDLFKWHTDKIEGKGIPCIQTKGGVVVKCVEVIKQVWAELKLESIDVNKIRVARNNLLTEIMPMEFDLKGEVERYERRIQAYFRQHNKNLKKFS